MALDVYSDPGAGARFSCCCETEWPGSGATCTDPRVAETEVAAGGGAAMATTAEAAGAGAMTTAGAPEASMAIAAGAGAASHTAVGAGFD